MKDFADIAAVLLAQAPRQQAASVLTLLVVRSQARSGAVLALREGRLVLFASSRDLTAEAIADGCALWQRSRAAIEGGTFVTSGEHLVAPIRSDDRLLALLYLETATAFEASSVKAFEMTFAKAIEADATGLQSDPHDLLLASPQQDKERLIAMLNRNEWNIARVARLMGVTRRTVYLRMERYGITRLRVPKSNTPRQRGVKAYL
jgi:hypothetical protein